MFIYNVKISGSKVFKIFIILVAITITTLFIGSLIHLYQNMRSSPMDGCVKSETINEILPKNYTNVLKAIHDNLDEYIGQQIKFSGYIYRAYDFQDSQFVLARNMVISSDYQTLIVGFLCNYEKAYEIADGTWVEIVGTITKGDYHGEIPEIKITECKTIEKPTDEYVYPPEDSYVPTTAMF